MFRDSSTRQWHWGTNLILNLDNFRLSTVALWLPSFLSPWAPEWRCQTVPRMGSSSWTQCHILISWTVASVSVSRRGVGGWCSRGLWSRRYKRIFQASLLHKRTNSSYLIDVAKAQLARCKNWTEIATFGNAVRVPHSRLAFNGILYPSIFLDHKVVHSRVGRKSLHSEISLNSCAIYCAVMNVNLFRQILHRLDAWKRQSKCKESLKPSCIYLTLPMMFCLEIHFFTQQGVWIEQVRVTFPGRHMAWAETQIVSESPLG